MAFENINTLSCAGSFSCQDFVQSRMETEWLSKWIQSADLWFLSQVITNWLTRQSDNGHLREEVEEVGFTDVQYKVTIPWQDILEKVLHLKMITT